MNNYLIYNNKENFLTHREISNFSTNYFCLMIDFLYSNNYIKVNFNNNSIKYIETLNLTFKKHYTNSKTKTNLSNFLFNKEELHANTPTDLGGNYNFYFCVYVTSFIYLTN